MKTAAALAATALLASVLAGCGAATHHASLPRPSETTRVGTATAGQAHAADGDYVAPVTTIQLVPPLAKYAVYVDKLLVLLRAQVGALHTAARHGALAAAEDDWSTAHFTWLELGQDDAAYGAFGQLGQQIDGLAAGLPGTVHNPGFTGFHRIELDLWRHHDLGIAAADSARLAQLVAELSPALVQRDLPLTATSLDSWVLRCHEILEDGLRDSLSGADDYGSNTDLSSLAADVNATHEMLDVLAPLISARRAAIIPEAVVDLRTLARAIVKAGGPTAHRSLRALPLRERQALDAATGAATETLAPVSEILQIAVVGS
jgi:high-affinity iron transporter